LLRGADGEGKGKGERGGKGEKEAGAWSGEGGRKVTADGNVKGFYLAGGIYK